MEAPVINRQAVAVAMVVDVVPLQPEIRVRKPVDPGDCNRAADQMAGSVASTTAPEPVFTKTGLAKSKAGALANSELASLIAVAVVLQPKVMV